MSFPQLPSLESHTASAVTDSAAPLASEEEVRTLFVSGLPSDVTERELYLIFNRCEGFDNSHLYATCSSCHVCVTVIGYVVHMFCLLA